MKKNVIGYCPICEERLMVKTLSCEHCNTDITGEFVLSPFDYLSKESNKIGIVKSLETFVNFQSPLQQKRNDLLSDYG